MSEPVAEFQNKLPQEEVNKIVDQMRSEVAKVVPDWQTRIRREKPRYEGGDMVKRSKTDETIWDTSYETVLLSTVTPNSYVAKPESVPASNNTFDSFDLKIKKQDGTETNVNIFFGTPDMTNHFVQVWRSNKKDAVVGAPDTNTQSAIDDAREELNKYFQAKNATN